MKRLLKQAELYGNEDKLKEIFDDIYDDYKNDIRRMKAYKRDEENNDETELFVYLPKSDTFDLILPYVDSLDSLFGYQIVTFKYSELYNEDLELGFQIFLDKISSAFDSMYIEDKF